MFFKNAPGKKSVVKTYGAEVLKKPAQRISAVTDGVRRLAEDMLRALVLFDGIGLAAPQYGESLRLVVLDVPQDSAGEFPSPGEKDLLPRMPLALVNPEILSTGSELSARDEGCLSVPEIFGPVTRPSTVRFRAETLDGGTFEYECGGLLARCIQHELDHLDGILFVDRMDESDRKTLEPELEKLFRHGRKNKFQRVKH